MQTLQENKTSLKEQILNNIRAWYPNSVHNHQIEKLAQELGYSASNGTRRARELAQAGAIERSTYNGQAVYRWKPVKVEQQMKQEQLI